MGRPRKIQSVKAMEAAWAEYKRWCDDQEVLVHDFSAKNSEFVSARLSRCITYTIEGFCVWLGLTRSAFYDTYDKDERYSDIVARMREECEVDARRKFELQLIPERLAPLWMSKHGYSTRVEAQPDKALEKLDGLLKEFSDAVGRSVDAETD